ncbi:MULTISPECIES: DoxX family protein [unclassified Pseudactinotalea]|uniref:DoxX family protein n=1 Tax=unclassified Pseudactinotalea TaxID=2649176 RepID=UPI00128DCAC4|nr:MULTISPECIES: DoxX family protein [unclassified Pseudactinotalea]MPV50195.1 DoxX family membrane protein [Pseudactinotalea sp. HY160]QGH70217.1 DoxX family membrane protein [Pseudactinotalea sp. HY158]
MSIGRFALRVTIGGLFVGHGLQKLTGSFGGPGLAGTEQMMTSLELYPPHLQALAAGATETAAGAMLTAGLLTPIASAGLVGVMTTAIRTVHAPNGLWNAKGGWEFNAVMIAAALTLAEEPGRGSLDAAFGRARWGSTWAVAALVGGMLASTATIAVGRRMARAAAEHEETAEGA